MSVVTTRAAVDPAETISGITCVIVRQDTGVKTAITVSTDNSAREADISDTNLVLFFLNGCFFENLR